MTRVKPSVSTLLMGALLLGVATWISGCGRQSEEREEVVQPAVLDPPSTPEQTFERIADEFSRAIETGNEGIASGFIIRGEDGHSRLTIDNKVTSQFFPPTQQSETYRGVITVTTRSSYFLQRSGTSSQDSSRDERHSEPEAGADPLGVSGDEGMEIFDEDLVTSPSTQRRSEAGAEEQEDVVARRSDEIVSQYELLYKDGRWVLVTELDPDTERSIANAFDHILSSQP